MSKRHVYVSPTSLALFFADKEEFYLKYVCEHRPPRIPQTEPMAAGSAFDAYVKKYFTGKEYFDDQVEEQNRDFGHRIGARLFEQYKEAGGLSRLETMMKGATSVRFESTVEGTVTSGDSAVNILGKPDLYFTNNQGARVIVDWKVNSITRKTSPKKGHLDHKNCLPLQHCGIMVNANETLDSIYKPWATQLAMYAWVLGEKVGDDFIVQIDQLVGNLDTNGAYGTVKIRLAHFSSLINPDFQHQIYTQATLVYDALVNGMDDLLPNYVREELDQRYLAYKDEDPKFNKWFTDLTRRHKY